MARKATGQIVERDRSGGRTFALRFRAYGKRRYLSLGPTAQGWTRRKAEDELANVLADVRRGIWKPTRPEEAAVESPAPTFHEFASLNGCQRAAMSSPPVPSRITSWP